MPSTFCFPTVHVHDAHQQPREGNPCEKPAHPVMDVMFVEIRYLGIIYESEQDTNGIEENEEELRGKCIA